MLSAACPRCGRPRPVSLWRPDVCGADLQLGAQQGVTSCGYCQTDNVVTEAVTRQRELAIDQVETYARGLDAESRRIERESTGVGMGLLVAVAVAGLVGPLFGCLGGAVLARLLAAL